MSHKAGDEKERRAYATNRRRLESSSQVEALLHCLNISGASLASARVSMTEVTQSQ